ncbi:Mechanosensitive ion channel [Halogranum rubrum]|uniref:Mechanosensitive ion channel n=1 Tax=Halogranum rubrum TaxID=553466 RepID=A0A1I4CVJ1_9EURY|nr:mechanosensitive ion channel domain-containing protein [Halogranum rubrum]SFK84227.1 Mechanosensitive ion channel [Halogranum rubrum]
MFALQSDIVTQAFFDFVANLRTALPAIISGLVFLLLAGMLVKAVLFVVKLVLKRTLPGESPVYRQFVATIVAVFLWFAVGLSFLSIVGLEDIAASLGTAAGFVALGVSYATSSMIADAVAGVYLLRDPDFMPGDTVEAGDTTGVVDTIELRKTRLLVDGDVVVRGNAEIEKKWRKLTDADEIAEREERVTS